MLNGYVTMEELCIITGFSKERIKDLMQLGMPMHKFKKCLSKEYLGEILFNIKEVEKWLILAIY